MSKAKKVSRDTKPIVGGRIKAIDREQWPLPAKGKKHVYIFTSAQNNTHLHDAVWQNLLALAKHDGGKVFVSTFTYNKAAYGKGSVKRGTKKATDSNELFYDKRIEAHVLDRSVIVAPGLIWCGEQNILPTAVKPLSGLESYTGRSSSIIPHTKFAMKSVPSGKHEGTKLMYTTGTVTQRNYIQKKEGLKAEFHHGYGGLIVEVDDAGNWFCRQLNADSEGVICDLDRMVKGGKVTTGHRVEAINWGDIHVGTIPKEAYATQWDAKDSMMAVLRPRYQFMHDTLDFRPRSLHDMKNHHKLFKRWAEGNDNVAAELDKVATFLRSTQRGDCQTVVVYSNHDSYLEAWLRECDYRRDPLNAECFLELQRRQYQAIREKDRRFHAFEWAVLQRTELVRTTFLRMDDSFIICHDANGGIECGHHGHRGSNGSRGSAAGFAKMGRKSNRGHEHTAGIEDGAYCSGITGDLDQEYNEGPSSWSRTHIVTYSNGKRALYTIWGNKWHA